MGSSTSHHGSHPPPKQTLKRTLPSIFICGSSSSTPPIEMEDDSSEDYHDPDNTPKSQRRRKEFEFTNPKNENAASSSNLDVNVSPYEDTPFSDPNSSNIIERVTQSPHLNEEINDTSEETTPSILDQEHRDEVFRDDHLVGSRELRRDGRRLFWDAFSRRNSRRNSDSQALHDSGDSGSRERWFLDFGGNSLDRGTRNITRGRRHSRSEIWERIRGGLDGIDRRTNRCPSGLHPDGTCSCEPDTRPHASISRIVMLAEALFEVLDEIHRQPMSLSLPMLSLPAPESVVDSLPVKIYRNKHKIENDLQQCHICLAEYEEEDEIRILPCQHEFHTSCIDKWLKETQRVCPLCRGDVCGVSSPEIRQA